MYKFTLALLTLVVSACTYAGPLGSDKISIPLQQSLQSKHIVDVLVSFNGESTSDVLGQLTQTTLFVSANRGEKATAVYKVLTSHAVESQKNVFKMLKSSSKYFAAEIQSLWITNQIYVKGADKSLIQSLAAMDEVNKITEDEIIFLDEPVKVSAPEASLPRRNPGILAEWGIDKIRAPAAWASYGTGVGGVIGIIDTGARYTHEAIRDNYRGGQHSWFNPYSRTEFPGDGHGHGTHVTGTIAGILGIGVAPGAKWISCKGLTDSGSGTWANLILCGQFMACPHDYTGNNADCTKVPDAVSNSWGVGSGSTEFDDVLRAWHAVGIVPVKSLGNGGPSCRSPTSPGDSQVGILGIGATMDNDAIASFSSRGPSVWNEQKPQVSAPGNIVRSAYVSSDTSYTTMSGTSMAAPHVAGLVALMRSNNPRATYAQIKSVLESSAQRSLVFTGETCVNVPDNQFPNFKYGFGRIDAYEAVKGIRQL